MSETTAMELVTPPPVIPDNAPSGLENIDTADLPVPRLSLMQALSDMVAAKKASPGEYCNSITEQIYAPGTEFIFLAAREGAMYSEKRRIICRSNDGITSIKGDTCKDCPHAVYWRDWTNGAPKCAQTKEFLILERSTLSLPVPDLMMFTFSRTSHGLGKKILAQAQFTAKPLYAMAHKFDAVSKDDGSGPYYTPKITPAGWLTQAEFDQALKIFNAYSGKVSKAKLDGDDDINF